MEEQRSRVLLCVWSFRALCVPKGEHKLIVLYFKIKMSCFCSSSCVSTSDRITWKAEWSPDCQIFARGVWLVYRCCCRNDRIFLQESSWASECGLVAPPHTTIAGTQMAGVKCLKGTNRTWLHAHRSYWTWWPWSEACTAAQLDVRLLDTEPGSADGPYRLFSSSGWSGVKGQNKQEIWRLNIVCL